MLCLALLVCLLAVADPFSMPLCDKTSCKTLTEADCPAGIGRSATSCCPFCLLDEGSYCGAIALGSPRCGKGLMCFKKDGAWSPNSRGVCIRKGTSLAALQKIAGLCQEDPDK